MEIHHDPRTKQHIKDMLYDHLYMPVKVRFDRRLREIIRKNCILISSPYECFTYKGEVYVVEPIKEIPRRMPRLSCHLFDEMNQYLKELKELNSTEIPYVLGYLNQVLNSSNSIPDYLSLLPESIHSPLIGVIDSCPCRSVKLSPQTVSEMKEKNNVPITLIKKRLMLNLIE